MNRKEYNSQETKKHIFNTFLSLLKESSIEKITVNALCSAAGIAKSTFYSYFEDKYSVLDGIENEMLGRLADVNAHLEDVDINLVLNGSPLPQATETIDYILANLEAFRIILGPHGDSRFESRWRRNIADSFKNRFIKEKGDPKSADLACSIFASTLIGIYTHFIFNDPEISREDFALILGNTFKYAQQDFLPKK